jgi:integrase/recombinase XerC
MARQTTKEAPPKWTEALQGFAAHLEQKERSIHTRSGYMADLNSFASWFKGEYQDGASLASLGGIVLIGWKSHLANEGQMPASVNRRLASLRSFTRWANKAGLIEPVDMPDRLEQVPPPLRWLNRLDELNLLRVVDNSKDARGIAIVKVLRYTGLRINELAELLWSDLEMSPRGGNVTVRRGKGRKRREVPLNAEARKALLAYDDGSQGQKIPVFDGQRGPLTVKGIHRIVEAYGKQAELEGFSAHVLRHTFCRRLHERGENLVVIAKLAGHSSLETTRRYVEASEDDLRSAVERQSPDWTEPAERKRKGRPTARGREA